MDYPDARKQLEYQAQLRLSSNRKMSSALKESSSGAGSGNQINQQSGSIKTASAPNAMILLKKSMSGGGSEDQTTCPGNNMK